MKFEAHMKRLIIAVIVLCALSSFVIPADTYSIEGVVLDVKGEKAVTTLLLQTEDGVEVQRTETKKRMGKGKFKFKKVLPGEYVIDINAGPLGQASVPVSIIADDLEDLEIHLSSAPKTPVKSATEPVASTPTSSGGQDQSYIINELSFEIKKWLPK